MEEVRNESQRSGHSSSLYSTMGSSYPRISRVPHRITAQLTGCERSVQRRDIDQVVRDLLELFERRLVRSDLKIAVNLNGVT